MLKTFQMKRIKTQDYFSKNIRHMFILGRRNMIPNGNINLHK